VIWWGAAVIALVAAGVAARMRPSADVPVGAAP